MKTKILIISSLLLCVVHVAQGSIPPNDLKTNLGLWHKTTLESAGCAADDESLGIVANEGVTNTGAGCRSTIVGSDYGAVSSGNTHKFTGHIQDAATGQYYAKARYFTTQLGRWSQPEPLLKGVPKARFLANPQMLNPYVYCANNPTRFVDPDGKFMLIVEFNRNAQYGSKALVWNGWLPDGIYNMKTRADIIGTNAAVKSGVYDYKLGKHAGSYFPKHDALIINNNKAVPTEAPNPAQGGKNVADGIHSHAGNPSAAGKKGTGSAGCWTVPTVQSPIPDGYSKDVPQTWSYYNDYISNFEDDPSGKAVLIRPGEILDDIKDLFKKDDAK